MIKVLGKIVKFFTFLRLVEKSRIYPEFSKKINKVVHRDNQNLDLILLNRIHSPEEIVKVDCLNQAQNKIKIKVHTQ